MDGKQLRDIQIRSANPSDTNSLAVLMNSHYARQKTEDYFAWQIRNNPLQTTYVVSCDGDSIVGMLGMQMRRMCDNRSGLQLVDMLIATEYRGRGLFTDMIRYCLDNLFTGDFLFVLPNTNGKHAVEKLGWVTVGRIDEMVFSDIKIEVFPTEAPESLSDYKIRPLLSVDMEQWRFNEHPEISYFYVHINADEYAVLKVFKDHNTGTYYGDIVFTRHSNNLKCLYEACIKLFRSLSVEKIATWALPKTIEYQISIELGFRPEPRERYLCIKPISGEHQDICCFENWALSQADAEMY